MHPGSSIWAGLFRWHSYWHCRGGLPTSRVTLWGTSGTSGPRCWEGLGRRLLLLPPAALAAHLGWAVALRAPVVGLPVRPAAALLPA